MTICIAAICKGERDEELIVLATDRMISVPQVGQFEMSLNKYKKIAHNVVAMLSGESLIFSEIVEECGDIGFDDIKAKIQQNMLSIRDERIQKQILDIYKTTHDQLKEFLKVPLQNPYLTAIFETISKFSLKTNILLTGFKDANAQIVEITENAMADMRDLNFGAIGSGATQALNTLLFQRHSLTDSLPTTVYNVYKAKRNAEASTGVGKEIDMMVLSESGVVNIDDAQIDALRFIYEEELNHGKNRAQALKLTAHPADEKIT